MTAETPPPGDDPSMEDILASIRRILNEDEAPAEPVAAQPAAAPAPTPAPAAEEVLLLDETMRVMPAAAPAPPPEPEPEPEPEPPPVVAAEPEPVAEPATAPEPAEPPMPQEGLLAPAPAAEAVALLSGLVRTLAAERGAQVHRGGPTIEDLVREEIRPLLKSWLDQHLPPLVQRLVQAEIERVANRAMP